MNPYKVTEQAMDALHDRVLRQIPKVFRKEVFDKVAWQVYREENALRLCPYTYAILIVDEVIKKLRYHRIKAVLEDRWDYSCCAWLLNMTIEPQLELAGFYWEDDAELPPFDDVEAMTMRMIVAPKWGIYACLEMLREQAMEWGFWLWECSDGSLKLIGLDHEPDDRHAVNAPIIKIVVEQ